jgi:hypothetical protein
MGEFLFLAMLCLSLWIAQPWNSAAGSMHSILLSFGQVLPLECFIAYLYTFSIFQNLTDKLCEQILFLKNTRNQVHFFSSI